MSEFFAEQQKKYDAELNCRKKEFEQDKKNEQCNCTVCGQFLIPKKSDDFVNISDELLVLIPQSYDWILLESVSYKVFVYFIKS